MRDPARPQAALASHPRPVAAGWLYMALASMLTTSNAIATSTTATLHSGRIEHGAGAQRREQSCVERLYQLPQRLIEVVLSRSSKNAASTVDERSIFTVLMQLVITCSLISGVWLFTWGFASSRRAVNDASPDVPNDRKEPKPGHRDPSLLQKYSQCRSYTLPVHGFTYPSVRTFYRPHPQADKLPTKPSPLPLLVFVHGLGGSLAQFHLLLNSLVNLAPCLGIDLPGCGLSAFEPKTWDAYTTSALVELLSTVIDDYRHQDANQGIVFIGHSMGCSLSALLASSTSPYSYRLDGCALGLLAICPKARAPSEEEAATIRKLLYIPTPIFDFWRQWDRRGGTNSKSVERFVGKNADAEARRLQVKFNEQSKSDVWRRMVAGLLKRRDKANKLSGGLPGGEVWAGLNMPVFLVAGAEDTVTTPKEMQIIVNSLKRAPSSGTEQMEGLSSSIPDSAAPVDVPDAVSSDHAGIKHITLDGIEISSHEEPATPLNTTPTSFHLDGVSGRVLKTTTLPPPAGHGLLYTTGSSRILAGLLSDFMASHISPRLSLGWQLQYLSTEGKWDVKNLAKWQDVRPVSEPIAGIFRAMKTLREVDERHSPEVFVKEWGGKIRHVVDISHDNPVYDPRGLEKGGIKYHKFPTISKIPPTPEEVADFIALVDRLLAEEGSELDEKGPATSKGTERPLIAVHCHYGFNRTGFFIVCYLIEKRGFSVQSALDEFERGRPPGIRHDHFIDSLFVRYFVGLRRAPTH